MKRSHHRLKGIAGVKALSRNRLWWIAVGLGILFLTAVASSQFGGVYSITSSAIDGGAGRCEAWGYALTGTSGQADIGLSTGGVYALHGGFWGAGAVPATQSSAARSWTLYK